VRLSHLSPLQRAVLDELLQAKRVDIGLRGYARSDPPHFRNFQLSELIFSFDKVETAEREKKKPNGDPAVKEQDAALSRIAELDAVAREIALLKQHGVLRAVRIHGHTDAQASLATNLALSERRAAYVVDQLRDRYGIDLADVDVRLIGCGEAFAPDSPRDSPSHRISVIEVEVEDAASTQRRLDEPPPLPAGGDDISAWGWQRLDQEYWRTEDRPFDPGTGYKRMEEPVWKQRMRERGEDPDAKETPEPPEATLHRAVAIFAIHDPLPHESLEEGKPAGPAQPAAEGERELGPMPDPRRPRKALTQEERDAQRRERLETYRADAYEIIDLFADRLTEAFPEMFDAQDHEGFARMRVWVESWDPDLPSPRPILTSDDRLKLSEGRDLKGSFGLSWSVDEPEFKSRVKKLLEKERTHVIPPMRVYFKVSLPRAP
jgi:hypothetical protein